MTKLYSKQWPVLSQGNLDGLCGIYAMMNYFSRKLGLKCGRDDAKLKRGFVAALTALQDDRALTADQIVHGYRQGQLRKAFLAASAHFGLKSRSVTIASQAKEYKTDSVLGILKNLTEGDACVLKLRNPNHWALAYRDQDGKFWLDDSVPGNDRRVALTDDLIGSRKIEPKRGLVFLNA